MGWTIDAKHCYETKQDCDSCSVHRIYGLEKPDPEKKCWFYSNCKMPYALPELLEKHGEPGEIVVKANYRRIVKKENKIYIHQYIQRKPGCSYTEIASKLDLSLPCVRDQIKALQQQGLVYCKEEPNPFPKNRARKISIWFAKESP